MMARIYCFLVMLFSIFSLMTLGVSSRHFAPPNDGFSVNNRGTLQETPSMLTSQISSNEIKGIKGSEDEEYRGMEKIGSKPPRCEDKCYGCKPCEAIQVPTTNSHVGHVQYTNYEPEGWKCKCGHTFFSP